MDEFTVRESKPEVKHSARGRSPLRRAAGVALEAVLDLVYPRHCAGCETALAGTTADFLCARCEAAILPIDADRCLRCGRRLGSHVGWKTSCGDCRRRDTFFTRALAPAEFEGVWRHVLHRFKFGRERVLARALARPMVDRLLADGFGISTRRAESTIALPRRWWIGPIDALVPVPLGSKREEERRFNQAAILARECAPRLGVPVWEGALRRVQETASQVGQTRAERMANLTGAFEVPKAWRPRIVGARLCVIDDILTTGATATAVARTLKAAGARRVIVAAAARKS